MELLGNGFLAVAAACVLAGLVRGFTGFGSAMVFAPVASAVYGPRVAVPLLFVVDALVTLPMLVAALRRCTWAEVVPLSAGAALAIPLGVTALAVISPLLVRGGMSVAVLLMAVPMAAGWRYRRRPSLPATLLIGGTSGFAGGVAGLYGPPVILFWLGGQADAPTFRANVIVFFGLVSVVAGVTFWLHGLLTRAVLTTGAVLIPLYALALWIGARGFRHAPEPLFRRLALGLVVLIAITSFPGVDGIWH